MSSGNSRKWRKTKDCVYSTFLRCIGRIFFERQIHMKRMEFQSHRFKSAIALFSPDLFPSIVLPNAHAHRTRHTHARLRGYRIYCDCDVSLWWHARFRFRPFVTIDDPFSFDVPLHFRWNVENGLMTATNLSACGPIFHLNGMWNSNTKTREKGFWSIEWAEATDAWCIDQSKRGNHIYSTCCCFLVY